MTPHAWILEYFRTWRERDSSSVGAWLTEDATYRPHPLEEPHVGHDGIRAYWQRVTSRQAGVVVRFCTPIVSGDRATVEWRAELRDPDGGWVTLPGIGHLPFAPDGRWGELRETRNLAEGRHQAPPGWGP